MSQDLNKFMSGYRGKDSMRDYANKMIREESKGLQDYNPPASMSSPDRTKIRPYKKGGPVKSKIHKLTRTQTDLKIPSFKKGIKHRLPNFERSEYPHMKKQGGALPLNIESFSEVDSGRHGGRSHRGRRLRKGQKHRYDDGGLAQNSSFRPMVSVLSTREDAPVANKRGGSMKSKGCVKKAGGGSIYEREMLGERPSRKTPHINYETDMKGEKPIKKAAGGVAKIRHGVADKNGRPKMSRKGKDDMSFGTVFNRGGRSKG